MSGISGPSIINSGLVLALDAANRTSYVSGSKNWLNLAGTSVTGSLKNGVGFSRTNCGNLVFDGTNDFVSTPITETYQNFTLGCWFYNTTSAKVSRALFSKNSYYATVETDWPVSLLLNAAGTSVTVNITSGTSYFITVPSTGSSISATLASLNTWYYVTATYDKVNLNLYLNGILQSTAANTISLPNNTARTWTIGRCSFEFGGGVNDSQYNGNIALTQIYNRALSATEILQNYNATKARFGL